ncbi:hypothetical protein BOVATA_038270 [Babesia ovata]|uniref:Uncharacterized protein n=1 Tax=Babesia ovata TaxID=189622 RepID=A0A2H6KH63_9APIC|nr:uncharacterized protein BOVATA_038270 [Babesia ovata]GBE62334.1 hypothetical protein BOVATA_038270 [Babesia ovata]
MFCARLGSRISFNSCRLGSGAFMVSWRLIVALLKSCLTRVESNSLSSADGFGKFSKMVPLTAFMLRGFQCNRTPNGGGFLATAVLPLRIGGGGAAFILHGGPFFMGGAADLAEASFGLDGGGGIFGCRVLAIGGAGFFTMGASGPAAAVGGTGSPVGDFAVGAAGGGNEALGSPPGIAFDIDFDP